MGIVHKCLCGKVIKAKGRINENLTGHKAVPLEIQNKVKKSICKIIIIKNKENIYGTGFFMKISDSLKFLFTNYHVINKDSINDNIELEIWNKKKMNLNLNQRYIKYFEGQKDITIIEIKKEDKIYKDIEFLEYDSNYKEKGYNIYKNADVFTLEHPLGNDVSCASGKILEIEEDYEFTHDISTESGSSGCPIILLNGNINLILVIGIHKCAQKNKEINYGTFIGGIIDEFKNDSIFFPKLKKNKEQKEEEEKEEEEKEEEKEEEEKEEKQEEEREEEKQEKQEEKQEEEKQEEEEDLTKKKNVIIDKKNLMKKDNFIIAQINIKKEEVKKFIRIINSYEENEIYTGHNENNENDLKESLNTSHIENNENDLEESLKNEKEIKQCEIIINEKKIGFAYLFGFKNKGIYTIKYTFKNLLTKINLLFSNCSSLINIDLSNFNTQNVTNMSYIFSGCSSLKEINLSNFNAQNVTNMSYMFSGCSSLKEINLSNFNAPNVTNMSYMFSGCSSLKKINLSNFNAKKVVDISYMFYNCSSLKNIVLSNFNAPNVTNMSYMFYGCSSLKNIDLSSFNTLNVTDMGYMFNGCSSLEIIDLSSFNTLNVTNMFYMFYGCSSLKAVNLHNFNFAKYKCYIMMFDGCYHLEDINIKDHKMRDLFKSYIRKYNNKN